VTAVFAFHPFQYALKAVDFNWVITDASLLAVPNLTSKKSEPEFPPPSPESAIFRQPIIK
jgi:hypothetical protein